MTEHITINELKNRAKIALTGNYTRCGLLLFFYYLVSLMLQRVLGLIPLLSVLPLILSYMFQFGLNLFFLKLSLGQETSPYDLFFVFRDAPKKPLCISCIFTAISIVCTMPANIILNALLLQTALPEGTLEILALAQLVLLLVWYVIHLHTAVLVYLSLDFQEASVKELFLLSVEKMKGQKLRYMLMELSFLPLLLLVIPTMGIGLLWILPYFYTTRSNFYLMLVNK